MATVVFESFEQIKIDGQAAGNIVDVISNHSPLKAEVLAAFNAFTAQLRIALDAEKSTLTTAHSAAIANLRSEHDTELAALNTENASAIANLQAQHTSEKATLATQLSEASATIATLQANIQELQANIEDLEQYRPYDPNVIKSESFYARITKDELFALAILANEDANAKAILALLNAYKSNAWQVVLDDPQVIGAMTYLLSTGLVTEERKTELLRPATQDEAYTAGVS